MVTRFPSTSTHLILFPYSVTILFSYGVALPPQPSLLTNTVVHDGAAQARLSLWRCITREDDPSYLLSPLLLLARVHSSLLASAVFGDGAEEATTCITAEDAPICSLELTCFITLSWCRCTYHRSRLLCGVAPLTYSLRLGVPLPAVSLFSVAKVYHEGEWPVLFSQYSFTAGSNFLASLTSCCWGVRWRGWGGEALCGENLYHREGCQHVPFTHKIFTVCSDKILIGLSRNIQTCWCDFLIHWPITGNVRVVVV